MEGIDLDAAFRQYSSYVARICIRLLGRDSDVDDCVQQVFLEAAKSLSQIREPAALKGWLATVAVRVAQKRLRTRRFKLFFNLDDSPEYQQLAAPGVSPEERAMLNRVYSALDRFPAAERTAWVLRHIEGEQLERVAEMSGCSLATAKRRIAKVHEEMTRVVAADGELLRSNGSRTASEVAEIRRAERREPAEVEGAHE